MEKEPKTTKADIQGERAGLPEFVTPEQLAKHLGWSARELRKKAREIGACRILGNAMILIQADVDAISSKGGAKGWVQLMNGGTEQARAPRTIDSCRGSPS